MRKMRFNNEYRFHVGNNLVSNKRTCIKGSFRINRAEPQPLPHFEWMMQSPQPDLTLKDKSSATKKSVEEKMADESMNELVDRMARLTIQERNQNKRKREEDEEVKREEDEEEVIVWLGSYIVC